MKWAVSNIAWSDQSEDLALALLKKYKIQNIEIAPSKIWKDLSSVSEKQAREYQDKMVQQGFTLVAMQSLLFNRPELKVFESELNRQATLTHLRKMVDLADWLGIKIMVFGSPKNRQRGQISISEAISIAQPFFESIGNYAHQKEIYFCLEANATHYGCDFMNTTEEADSFVRSVNSPGLQLHLDVGNMILSKENPLQQIKKYGAIAKHFHLSAPDLKPIHTLHDLKNIIPAVSSLNLTVSLEMLSEPKSTKDLELSLKALT